MADFLHDIHEPHVYNELKAALNSKRLILFAGAGLSAQATTDAGEHPPLWADLLRKMIAHAENARHLNKPDADELLEALSAGLLLEVAQELETTLGQNALADAVGKCALCHEAKPRRAHVLAVQIPFRAYITTNLDCFLEAAYTKDHDTDLDTVHGWKFPTAMARLHTPDGKPFIIKMHGDTKYGHIVLGHAKYQDLLRNDPNYRLALQSVFLQYGILFIGFGGTDPNVNQILADVAPLAERNQWWTLVPKGKYKRIAAKRLLDDKHVNVIEYEPDDQHSGVVEFLETLCRPPPVPQEVPTGPGIGRVERKDKAFLGS